MAAPGFIASLVFFLFLDEKTPDIRRDLKEKIMGFRKKRQDADEEKGASYPIR